MAFTKLNQIAFLASNSTSRFIFKFQTCVRNVLSEYLLAEVSGQDKDTQFELVSNLLSRPSLSVCHCFCNRTTTYLHSKQLLLKRTNTPHQLTSPENNAKCTLPESMCSIQETWLIKALFQSPVCMTDKNRMRQCGELLFALFFLLNLWLSFIFFPSPSIFLIPLFSSCTD